MNFRFAGRTSAPNHPKKPIFLQNTLSDSKEEFSSIVPDKVRMYNCGPTVYSRQHIGNMRAAVFSDVLRRMFEYNGYEVKQVVNLTDVGHLTGDNLGDADQGEDRMERQARESDSSVFDIAKEVTEYYFEDLKALNAFNPNNPYPKASDFIGEQIAFVKTLEEKGYTYKTSDGIYFDTSKFRDYGKLGNIHIEGLQEGARVEQNKEKHHPTDFALWKFSPENSDRQQEWESPWGVGFPGWHLECSALAMKFLGKRIDVHTGGIEHIPTHHNNEIAQTEVATGDTFSRFWLHNAHVILEGKKMAKSEGRVVYLYNITDRGISALAYRYWLLTSHYKTQVNFTWDALEGAQSGYFKLLRHFVEKLGTKNGKILPAYQEKFHKYINDDLDTPKVVALMHELIKDEKAKKADVRATLLDFDRVLGLGFGKTTHKILENLSGERKLSVDDTPKEITALLEERESARAEKNFERADQLRDEIESKGFEIVDGPTGAALRQRI